MDPGRNKVRRVQNNDGKQKALLERAPPSFTMDHGGIIRNQEQASIWRMVSKLFSSSK